MAMKRILATLTILLAMPLLCSAQQRVTIEECYQNAQQNYPLIARYSLIEKTKEYSLKNASLAYVPKFAIDAQATYQTQVIALPFEIPGISIPSVSKDQYKASAELQQAIWDGGVVRAQRKNLMATADAEQKSLDVDIYELRGRVNSLFFGVLLLDRQLEATDLLNEELWRNFRLVESYLGGGIATSADLDAVSVEIISNNQRRAAIESSRKAYLDMLSMLTGLSVGAVEEPSAVEVDYHTINRPEIDMFEAQRSVVEAQKYAISARGLPRIGLFVQGAYANPGLNFFESGWTPYAIGGVKLSWDFSGWYSSSNDKKLIEMQKRNIDALEQTFKFNTNLSLKANLGEIERLRTQLEDDDKIIRLRGNVKRAAQAKVEGGTTTVNEMLREVTAENEAIIKRSTHEIELLKELYDIKYKTNN